jgi:rubrerythrin
MNNEWDREGNILTDEDRRNVEEELAAERRRQWEEMARIRREQYQARRAAQGFFAPEYIDNDVIRENFQRFSSSEMVDGRLGHWAANRLHWVCHNCGTIGHKCGDTSELFKCYSCNSRNMSVLRAGEISMAIRNRDLEYGINMQEVYNARRERLRQKRRERRSS